MAFNFRTATPKELASIAAASTNVEGLFDFIVEIAQKREILPEFENAFVTEAKAEFGKKTRGVVGGYLMGKER